MEKTILLAFILVLTAVSTNPVHSAYYETLPYEPVKLQKTHLRFFVHDTLSGPNPSSIQITRTNRTSKNDDPAPFGAGFAIDDPLTEGPDIKSTVIGNSRGFYLSTSQGKDLTLTYYTDIGFTTGIFKGSSLSVFSRNPVTEGNNRELAVVGGRGKFRYAKGAVFIKNYSLNTTTGDAVLEFNVDVIHP